MQELTPTKLLSIADYFSSPEMIKTIKSMVAIGSTNEEFLMFRELCISSGLNPLKREVWFIKPKNAAPQIMTGINGFLKIANSHPQFDGMVKEEILDKNGNLKGAKVSVYRKDRKYPSIGIALLSEYAKPSGQWPKMPHTMIFKVAMTKAIREAFEQECNGLYTEEEMPDQYSIKNIKVVATQEKTQSEEEPLEGLPLLVKNNQAWAYAPLSYDDEEGRHVVVNSIKGKVPFIADKENKWMWVADQIPELEVYCRHKPVQQPTEKAA